VITFVKPILIYLIYVAVAIALWHWLVQQRWKPHEDARWLPAILFVFLPGFYFVWLEMPSHWIIIVQFFGFVAAFLTKKGLDFQSETRITSSLRRKIYDELGGSSPHPGS